MVSWGFMHLLVLIHLVVLLVRQRKKCFQTFMSASSDVLEAFGDLGRGVVLPSSETVAALENIYLLPVLPKRIKYCEHTKM